MIHVIYRTCKFSNLSVSKERPAYFSREKCLVNMWKTSAHDACIGDIKYHYLFDGDLTNHFILSYLEEKEIIKLNSKSGARSFVDAVEYACSLDLKDNDIIYFLEDDYLHRINWTVALKEGLDIEDQCWISLYDHGDKYYRCLPINLRPMYQQYQNYTSEITHTKGSYWRSACSTTDTFGIKYKNLITYKNIITKWSKLAAHSLDHNRGLELNDLGLKLWTPMPGYSTHMEPAYMSPMVNWEMVQKDSTNGN